MKPTLLNGMIAVTAMWWPWYTRLVYNITRGERPKAMCWPPRSQAPPAPTSCSANPAQLRPAIVTKMTLDAGFVILIASSLSFLGLGVQAPARPWQMVAEGAKYLPDQWWLSVFPGLAILIASSASTSSATASATSSG